MSASIVRPLRRGNAFLVPASADSIVQRPVGGLAHPQIDWQNRPTYQQVTEFAAH
ncbi:hypothetical protein ACFY04_33770 [Streptomyces sp. NPDC001549]|uniref:hypothetical protein n=1 Tax=Streptomyces sp. NPDC001549 TaxID=3364586 RepID=UPI00369FC4B6